MSQLGMAAQAIDIVYQLNASEDADPSIYQRGASPLESLSFASNGKADVRMKNLVESDRLMAFRYSDDSAEELQQPKCFGARPAVGAGRILPNLSGAADPDR